MKIYVGNLPFNVQSDKLKEIFSEIGSVKEATVITDKFSGRSKGFGFVEYENDEDGQKAIKEMNGKKVDGRELKVDEARPRQE